MVAEAWNFGTFRAIVTLCRRSCVRKMEATSPWNRCVRCFGRSLAPWLVLLALARDRPAFGAAALAAGAVNVAVQAMAAVEHTSGPTAAASGTTSVAVVLCSERILQFAPAAVGAWVVLAAAFVQVRNVEPCRGKKRALASDRNRNGYDVCPGPWVLEVRMTHHPLRAEPCRPLPSPLAL